MIEERILNRLADRLAAVLAPPGVPLARFVVDGALVGEIDARRVQRLRAFREVFDVAPDVVRFVPALRDAAARTRAMERVARALAGDGLLTAWRDERYPVAPRAGAQPLFLLERAAARYFGIVTQAAHVNGTTLLADGTEAMWLARRSASKAIDPGLLDNMVGGGVAHGADVQATLVKEAWEEAGIEPEVAARAARVGEIRIRRLQPDGVHHEVIHVHDLALPLDVVPVNQDGEVTAFRLVRPDEAATLAGNADGPDVVTADASLVLADWLLRRGYVRPGSAVARRLEVLRRGGVQGQTLNPG